MLIGLPSLSKLRLSYKRDAFSSSINLLISSFHIDVKQDEFMRISFVSINKDVLNKLGSNPFIQTLFWENVTTRL